MDILKMIEDSDLFISSLSFLVPFNVVKNSFKFYQETGNDNMLSTYVEVVNKTSMISWADNYNINFTDEYYKVAKCIEILYTNKIINKKQLNDLTYDLHKERDAYIERQSNDKKLKRKRKSKYKTYLIKNQTGFTKIGKALNPSDREKTLQAEEPTIYLFAICEKDIETKLHERYNKNRVRGEWFDLSEKQINYIINKYNFKLIKY